MLHSVKSGLPINRNGDQCEDADADGKNWNVAAKFAEDQAYKKLFSTS